MRRKTGFYAKLCTIENIELADKNARRNKRRSAKYIAQHDKHRLEENLQLLETFKNHTFKTSAYTKFKIYEPKERIIYKLPYYPDRIAQHAIMNVVKDYWTSLFITNTYSCIEGRGIHKCLADVKKDLDKTKGTNATKYCLKLDIVKFYPSINHAILKAIIRRKIKDKDFLAILDEIIDSVNPYIDTPGIGVPIGNYLSQFFANLYLTDFDHWCKEQLNCKYYYRYADDIVILGDNKETLSKLLDQINKYLNTNLNLKVKHTHQIFPTAIRGIDFVGYVIRPTHILIRKSIKNKINKNTQKYLNKQLTKQEYQKTMSSYFGWMKYADTRHLLYKIEMKTGLKYSKFSGGDTIISAFKNKSIYIVNVDIHNKYYIIHFIYNNKSYSVKSTNKKQLLAIKNNLKIYIL